MSKSDILAELPKLDANARGEILDELWRIEEEAALRGGPSLDEKAMLNRELADYESTRDAGIPWSEVEKGFAGPFTPWTKKDSDQVRQKISERNPQPE